jgi:hypothetical protein
VNPSVYKVRVQLVAFLLTLAVGFGTVGSVIQAEPAYAYDYNIVPIMPRSRMPYTLAGDMKYQEYRNQLAAVAYVCKRGEFLPLIMTPSVRSCVDQRMIKEAKSVKARLFHVADYYKINPLESFLLSLWSAHFIWWTAYAKQIALFGEAIYWSVGIVTCTKAAAVVSAAVSPMGGAVAGAACGKAFDKLNPYRNL